jgi:uncharacterized protein
MEQETVRWNIKVSRETDLTLRTFLGAQGMKKIKPYKAGRLVNQIKKLAEDAALLPRVQRSPDPTDDFLPALSEGGKADYLVTGDKRGLLALEHHKATRIISAREFAALFV